MQPHNALATSSGSRRMCCAWHFGPDIVQPCARPAPQTRGSMSRCAMPVTISQQHALHQVLVQPADSFAQEQSCPNNSAYSQKALCRCLMPVQPRAQQAGGTVSLLRAGYLQQPSSGTNPWPLKRGCPAHCSCTLQLVGQPCKVA